MNGWEFLEHYNDLPMAQKGGIVVVMLSTSLNPDDKAQADSLGYLDDFINKPLTVEMVQEILKRHFADRL